MSIVKTNTAHRGSFDHFEPEANLDASEQRRLRGALEQIDYTAFAANQAVLAQIPGALDLEAMKRLAVAAANARAQWIRAALQASETGAAPSREVAQHLADRRQAYDELCEAYEGIRRMIERGYIEYKAS
jgi:hypothetical protein